MDGYKIERTLLSSDDMQAILSGLRSLDSVSGTNRYRLLMDKLSADNSPLNAGQSIIIDLAAWDKSAVADKIGLIRTAIEKQEKIAFTYYSPDSESRRTIEP